MKFDQYIKGRKRTFKKRLITQLSYIKTYKIEIPFKEFVNGIKNLYYWIPIIWKDNNYGEHATFVILKSKLIKQLNSLKRFQNNEEFKFLGFHFFARHLVGNLEDIKYLNVTISLIDKIYLAGSNFDDLRTYEEEWHEYHKTEFSFMPTDTKIVEKIQNLETAANRERQMDSVLEDIEFEPVDIDDITMDVINDIGYDGSMLMNSTVKEDNLDIYFAKNKLLHKKAKTYIKVNNWSNSREGQAMVIGRLKTEKAKKLLYKILSEKIEEWSV
jgi:hypothetical protein